MYTYCGQTHHTHQIKQIDLEQHTKNTHTLAHTATFLVTEHNVFATLSPNLCVLLFETSFPSCCHISFNTQSLFFSSQIIFFVVANSHSFVKLSCSEYMSENDEFCTIVREA